MSPDDPAPDPFAAFDADRVRMQRLEASQGTTR